MRVLASLLLSALFAALLASGAGAHSTLLTALPEPASSVSELDVIELEFESALVDDGQARIALATIREGRDLPLGDTEFVSDYIIRAEVNELPPAGDYVIRYQVTSADGDLNDGGYSFTVLPEKGGAATWLLLGGGLAAVGVLAVLLRPRRPSPRPGAASA